MATLNVIRRWALREQMSIREISRRTGLARNTVKKYLRSDETEPTYAKRISPSKLDPYAEKLATWLGIEATKSRKQRRNLKQIYKSTAPQESRRTFRVPITEEFYAHFQKKGLRHGNASLRGIVMLPVTAGRLVLTLWSRPWGSLQFQRNFTHRLSTSTSTSGRLCVQSSKQQP